MRSSSLVAGLSIAAQVLAKQAPTLEVVARQLCGWQGHCYGDPCEGYSDCDGDMICIASQCRQPTPTTACVWPGHCLGDKCKTENDCDMDWICLAGQCAIPDEDPAPVIPEPTTTPSATCEFPGHCLGDPCVVHEDLHHTGTGSQWNSMRRCWLCWRFLCH
ncbi:hypothetical protein QBC33DRAFT_514536 [Phialemonium atrogriseum]|uniref:Uncharacterized protein n=1 Tax=Phialemonium atrogriseum TaxID=1093897 RepID=A0AAJ0C2F2_9PEZI|nr:uncharacterized protein QBC33DRAFT_514536 [Phialemonium atrogriseum]KAK1768272.1 hypothetical protein QBC33DRAFT_514536 [Phialemonium atrogriseum]